MANVLSLILRGGVWGAGALIFAGLALSLSGRAGGPVIKAGLGVLIAAPIVGAAAAAVFYAREGRWRLALAAVSLLIMIGLGSFLGH